jgi:sugar phosphate isomerase/epimerase
MQAAFSERIAIEFISVLGMPPLEYVELAADIGCRNIGLALAPVVHRKAYPMWSLRDDASLRRQLIGALRRHGISISLAEGFIAWPQKDIRDAGADMDLLCELGATRVNMLSLDPDRSRSFDQCAAFAEMAGRRGLNATLEFMPGLALGDLHSAVDAVRHVGRPNFGVLLDTMHFFRSGSTLEQLAAIDPAAIGYAQLCDVPLVSQHASYADEARFDRLVPGEGELPLRDFLAALPASVTVGVEVPMMARAEAGISARERLTAALDATQQLLQRAGEPDANRSVRR